VNHATIFVNRSATAFNLVLLSNDNLVWDNLLTGYDTAVMFETESAAARHINLRGARHRREIWSAAEQA
jgi:hypothetical protein